MAESSSKKAEGTSTSDNVAAAAAEKKVKRLREVFQKLQRRYRNAVYLLTGWKIDMNDSKLICRSMFASAEHDKLMFLLRDKDTALDLLSTPYAATLGDEIHAILSKYGSFPAFMCAITQQLFEQTTVIS